MAIKVSGMAPTKKHLDGVDPSGDSWVLIKPITYRDDMRRGELLKERETATTRAGSVTKGINMYLLRAEELWLTYGGAHIVLEDKDGEETQPFSDEMTKTEFMAALESLEPPIVLEWHMKLVEVNPDWAFPF
jgi:hypothetical protein